MKIKNRKKFTKSMIIIFTIIITLVLGINYTYSNVEIEYREDFICIGDTLWNIAKKEVKTNKYYKNKDIRQVVYEIKKINNLESSEVMEGQKILIPQYK